MADFSHLLPQDETSWLDAMDRSLKFWEGLDELVERQGRQIAGSRHPRIWSPYIEASQTDPYAWDLVREIVHTVLTGNPSLSACFEALQHRRRPAIRVDARAPEQLIQWA